MIRSLLRAATAPSAFSATADPKAGSPGASEPSRSDSAEFRRPGVPPFARLSVAGIAAAIATLGTASAGTESAALFAREVRPLLADACFHCHGPDPGTRKAGLRFDLEEGLFGSDVFEAVVVPGDPEASLIYQRITAEDPEDVMPPPDFHKQLDADEIALVRAWIEGGAGWQDHWAFVAPEAPELPEVADKSWPANPIDRFVLARLEAAGLEPAPEADPRALVRRLALDLTGLPPDPAEVEAYAADPTPEAYEALVDAYLASPRWGEHRGRYWLDAARYADTHGLHFDNYREMWLYRDWVIEAFNRNLPFDRFTVEQIAGDLLPDPDESQLIATGFQRCNMTTNEGGTIDEENLALYAADRVQTFGWVFLGLTMNCAQCHDHKFDPVSMRDYYAMAAFFRNTTQGPKDGNVKDSGPILVVPADEDRPRWEALPGEIALAEKDRAERREAAKPEFEAWLAGATAEGLEEEMPREALQAHLRMAEGEGRTITASLPAEASYEAGGELEWADGGRFGRAPVLSREAPLEFGDLGAFAADEPFSVSLWLRPARNNVSGAFVARMDNSAAHRGWDIFQENRNLAFHLVDTWPDNAIKVVTARPAVNPDTWYHVVLTYDGSGKARGVKLYLNGNDTPLRTNVDKLQPGAETRAETPLRLAQRSNGNHLDGIQVQDLRLYERRLSADEASTLRGLPQLRGALAAGERRNENHLTTLLDHFLLVHDEPWQEFNDHVVQLEGERDAIRSRSPVTHIQEEADGPAMAHILLRGEYDQLGEEVGAAVPAALHPMPEDAPANRLGLAKWVVDPANPLTARVTVNRFWQELFGRGLVATPDDFGLMGAPPSHPELLDWLALGFVESGWDVKEWFRTVVLSATYRQAALATEENLERDPDNALLSRGPRFRMDGEMIRDSALAASGTLSLRMGGPGTKPYQPERVWEVVGMGNARYEQDSGENLFRRTVYNYWKRMAPPASMEIFNAPNREVSCLVRDRTNTPLQALVTLNDVQFVEAARRLAELALRESDGDEDRALDLIARRVLSRPLSGPETDIMHSSRAVLLSHYREAPEDAAALLEVGESPADESLDPVLLATWTMVCNQVMNLDEALNK